MKYTIYLFIIFFHLLSISLHTHAQNHDQHWVGGFGSPFFPDELAVMMKFDDDGITYSEFHSDIGMDRGVIVMSDKEGELLFYTNGNVVASWDHQVMQNGKGFNEGSMWDDFGQSSPPP